MYNSNLSDFPRNIIVAQQQNWITATQIQKIVWIVDRTYFPINDARTQTLTAITDIIGNAPFSLTVRFPSDSAYVTTIDCSLSRIINQITSALNYKDRLIEKTNVGNTTVSTTSNTPQYIAALNSFNAARLQLSIYVSDYRNYFDQHKFERYYSISWI